MARKILLADDSVTAQNMGRRILTDAGYEVITVNNGSAALKKIAEVKPDLIVLDVYMPGYGGLEVCQRMRENKETARLPVLLTVGKLEPFKPDEARRVRADAYIIKPFEASELLTALAKLEDKIVPQPESYKPGRFAKAIAAVEQSAGEAFGDSETGWKERLIIPHPSAKPAEAEPEPVPPPAKSARDKKPVEPKRGFERPMPAGLPEDITPEEIAAITAAAAALNGQSAEPAAPAQVVPVDTATPAVAPPVAETTAEVSVPQAAVEETLEEAPATFASATQAEAVAEEAAPAPQAAAIPAEAAQVEEKKAEEAVAEVAISETPVAPEAVASPEVIAAEVPAASATDRVLNSDAEVLAALASLGSSSDIGSVSSAPSSVMQAGASELVAVAALSGPRWIAEAIPLSLEEATFVLEQEMEKQYAAFAAADAVCAALAAGSGSSVSYVSSAVAVEEAPVAEPEQLPVVAERSAEVEAQAAEAETVSSTAPQGSSPESEAAVSVPDSEAKGEAFAAAAGANASVSAVGTPSEAPDQNDADLAAAWANWKQIRGTILGSQTVVPITPTEASAAEEGIPRTPEEVPVGAQSEASAPAAESAAAAEETANEADSSEDISNMVDNMLAELKPKLMKEIAKKLKKEKR